MNTYIGIDLGQKGGIVSLTTYLDIERVSSRDMPLDTFGHLNIPTLFTTFTYLLGEHKNIRIIFEDITTLHTASKMSNLSLGKQSGAVEALCVALNLPYAKVPPKEWQAEMFKDLPPLRKKNGTSDTKGLAFIAAKKYFPNVKIQKTKDGITDALLIAEYGRRVYNK
jgi:hypothetical protein